MSRSSGTVSFSETLSLAPTKSTPPRCRGTAAWAVGELAVTVPCTIRRMLAESSATTSYSGTEPGTWAGRDEASAAQTTLPAHGAMRESPATSAPRSGSCQHGGPCLIAGTLVQRGCTGPTAVPPHTHPQVNLTQKKPSPGNRPHCSLCHGFPYPTKDTHPGPLLTSIFITVKSGTGGS